MRIKFSIVTLVAVLHGCSLGRSWATPGLQPDGVTTLRPRQALSTTTATSTSIESVLTVYVTINAFDPFQNLTTTATQTTSGATDSTTSQSGPTGTTTVTTTADGPFITNIDCSWASRLVKSCGSVSPGFAFMPHSSQSTCLCSISIFSAGNLFHSAVSGCALYASAADTSLYSELGSWLSFCNTQSGTTSASRNTSASRTGDTSTPPSASGTLDGIGITNLNHSSTGIIVGATMGGFGMMFIGLSLVFLFIRARSKRKREAESVATSAIEGEEPADCDIENPLPHSPPSLVEKQSLESPTPSERLCALQKSITL